MNQVKYYIDVCALIKDMFYAKDYERMKNALSENLSIYITNVEVNTLIHE